MSQWFIQLQQINSRRQHQAKHRKSAISGWQIMWQTAVPQCYIFARTFAQSKNKVPPFAVSESEVKALRWKWRPFQALEYICSQLPTNIHTRQHSNSVQRWQKALPVRALAPVIALLKLSKSSRLLLSQSTQDHAPGWTVQLEFNLLIFCSFKT